MENKSPVEFRFAFDEGGRLSVNIDCNKGLEEAAGSLLAQLTSGKFNAMIIKQLTSTGVESKSLIFGMLAEQVLDDAEGVEDEVVILPSEVFNHNQ